MKNSINNLGVIALFLVLALTACGIEGPQGETGYSPVNIIGDNGNWFIDGADTGVSAIGQPGPTGSHGEMPDITI